MNQNIKIDEVLKKTLKKAKEQKETAVPVFYNVDLVDIINKIEKKLERKLEKQEVKCMTEGWDVDKNDWNTEHFTMCEGDITAAQIDVLEEVKKKFKKLKGGSR